MADFHLQARLLRGGLAAPTRNETRSDESDDLAELEAVARRLARDGFAVWVYRRGPASAFGHGDAAFTVVGEWKAGRRVR